MSYTVEYIRNIAAQFPSDKKWTYSEAYQVFPQDLKIKLEIIHNQLIITPNPTPLHQIIVSEALMQFMYFIRQHQLGEILTSPLDVKFDENNVVQPDLLFLVHNFDEIENEVCITETPNMLIEIWLPTESQAYRDAKHGLYEQQGVTEFWQIYPEKQHIIIEVLDQEGKYQLFSEVKKEGTLRSKVLEGFEIAIQDLIPAPSLEKKKKTVKKTKK